jgi:hypothetical protein
MALNNWRSLHAVSPSANAMMFFHTIHLNLHGSMLAIQNLAHRSLQHPEIPVLQDCQETPSYQCFRSSEDQAKALWHAHRVLLLGRYLSSRIRNGNRSNTACVANTHTEENWEPDSSLAPHFAHSIFFAALCFWYGVKESQDHKQEVCATESSTDFLISAFRLGRSLLALPDCGISRLYQRILEQLDQQLC